MLFSKGNKHYDLVELPMKHNHLIQEELLNLNILENQTPEKGRNVMILPQIKESLNSNEVFFIVPKGLEDFISVFYNMPLSAVVGAKGVINAMGDEIDRLHESDMNTVLRSVYNAKPKKVYVSLLNSIWNNKHELAYRNLLKTPGYASIISSTLF